MNLPVGLVTQSHFPLFAQVLLPSANPTGHFLRHRSIQGLGYTRQVESPVCREMWLVYTVDFYSAAIYRKLKIFILREISPTQYNK